MEFYAVILEINVQKGSGRHGTDRFEAWLV